MPEVSKFLTVGLNSTTRHLETLMASATGNKQKPPSTVEDPPADGPDAQHMAVIFLPKSRNDLVYAHLPLMSRTASTLRPELAATRLVSLSPAAEVKIAAALGLPRAGVVGILEGASGSESLVDYVRQHVRPVEVPWIEEATKGEYLPLQTQTETS
ncbi:hypothetical protein W97_03695 [Coniosporium apollinis CBS 100218]|uniref:Uncharacterized protein n=1 Tax=Coniosporium apollinis (strain CBS 100218) TaxID=1168221 RepID=R7YRH8_CONA1|nr:uncharacterized protein W97_03695 [Coniosporium apollinis CBS 100218]EON64463.1 hypothetical protein W97_03695 [Coniosporium apollinis CBS 100218]